MAQLAPPPARAARLRCCAPPPLWRSFRPSAACPSSLTRASRGSVFSPIEVHTAQARLWPARCSSQPGGVVKGHAAFGPAPDDEPGLCGVSLWRLSWWEWRGHVRGDQARRRMLLAPGTDGLVVQRTVVCRVHRAWGYPLPPASLPAFPSPPPFPLSPRLPPSFSPPSLPTPHLPLSPSRAIFPRLLSWLCLLLARLCWLGGGLGPCVRAAVGCG
eukprot:scaffold12244_cov216-Isochrysis_galbana.AAC.12